MNMYVCYQANIHMKEIIWTSLLSWQTLSKHNNNQSI